MEKVRALLLPILLAGFLALAPPGLCPCWLNRDVARVHPHPYGHAEIPHDHGYLFDLYSSEPAQSPPILLAPQDVIDYLVALGGLWSHAALPVLGSVGWSGPPSEPPPRLPLAL
jgi:hypothetical protein